MSIQYIINKIKQDERNIEYKKRNIPPILQVSKSAKILIIGQAPGKKVEETLIPFNDKSGETLISWMGIDKDIFYSNKIAILPMDFYYPGKGKSGDLPPRQGFAEKWHPMILEHLPNIQLTILIGQYAQKYYLPENKDNVTDTVKNYRQFLPHFIPLVHPSPRNQLWMTKNPWFEEQVIPELQILVKQIINKD